MKTIDLDAKVNLIHGFSNKIRLQILESIKETEKNVSQIVEDINESQSSVSQHLACLKGCGLIVSRQEGKYVYYSLRNEQIYQLLTMFDEALVDVNDHIKTCKHHIV